jgi:hypothetical protein
MKAKSLKFITTSKHSFTTKYHIAYFYTNGNNCYGNQINIRGLALTKMSPHMLDQIFLEAVVIFLVTDLMLDS